MRDPEKRAASQRRYDASAKGRARRHRYNVSDKGRERNRRYDERSIRVGGDRIGVVKTVEKAQAVRAEMMAIKERVLQQHRDMNPDMYP